MPFKSQAQRRKFYAMADRGEISMDTVKRWEEHTPKGKKLPERVKKADLMYLPATGAMLGGLLGYIRDSDDDKEFRNALIGAGIGAGAGFGARGLIRYRRFRKMFPSWMGRVKTKKQARNKYYDMAKKHHPDKTGRKSPKMQQVATEWSEFKNSPVYEKLAFLEELGDIYGNAYGWQKHAYRLPMTALGAGLGGATGYLASDKNEMRNALIGAAIGGGVGFGAGHLLHRGRVAQQAADAELAAMRAAEEAARVDQRTRAAELAKAKAQRAVERMQAEMEKGLREIEARAAARQAEAAAGTAGRARGAAEVRAGRTKDKLDEMGEALGPEYYDAATKTWKF